MKHWSESDLREIQPYEQSEFIAARDRLASDLKLCAMLGSLFPGMGPEQVAGVLKSVNDVREFQAKVISTAIERMLKMTSGGLELHGHDRLRKDRKYVYVSNHRDILCDPALLTNALFLKGLDTPQICLGDNLLTAPWIVDLVKMNKGVTVKRNLSQRELFRWSHVLSAQISRQIQGGLNSVWIAQREGRTKDGNDETHPGVIKMLTLEGEGEFLDRVTKLHLVPIAISYEYDPCDALKARELFIREKTGAYVKAPGEDTQSMAQGLKGAKGRIRIDISGELDLSSIPAEANRREQLEQVSALVDREIHTRYHLWPSNYIALSVLESSASIPAGSFSPSDREAFLKRLEAQLDSVASDPDEREGIRRKMLEAYANPARKKRATG